MSSRSRSQSKLVTKSLPKNLIRAQEGGELLANLGASEADVRIAQQGLASQSWKSVEVYGVDRTGRARAMARLNIHTHADGNDHISIDADDSRTMLERIDGGYAKAVELTKRDFERKGLKAQARYNFTDEIERDPERKRAEQQRLGTESGYAPDWADGYSGTRVARLTPGRDRGQSLDIYRGKRRR